MKPYMSWLFLAIFGFIGCFCASGICAIANEVLWPNGMCDLYLAFTFVFIALAFILLVVGIAIATMSARRESGTE